MTVSAVGGGCRGPLRLPVTVRPFVLSSPSPFHPASFCPFFLLPVHHFRPLTPSSTYDGARHGAKGRVGAKEAGEEVGAAESDELAVGRDKVGVLVGVHLGGD